MEVYKLSLQLELPYGERNQRLLSLGPADDIQRSRILSRPEPNQRGERRHPEGPAGQPVVGQRDPSGLRRLLHLQRQHQHVLYHQVKTLSLFFNCFAKLSVTEGFFFFLLAQIGSWIPSNWWSNPFLPHKDGQVNSIHLSVGLFHPRLRDGLLSIHPLLRCGGDPWAPYTQVLLLQKHLEHTGYCCHTGKKKTVFTGITSSSSAWPVFFRRIITYFCYFCSSPLLPLYSMFSGRSKWTTCSGICWNNLTSTPILNFWPFGKCSTTTWTRWTCSSRGSRWRFGQVSDVHLNEQDARDREFSPSGFQVHQF